MKNSCSFVVATNKVAGNLNFFFITENCIRIVINFVYSPKAELQRRMSKFNC